ncbi:hypothetical protein EG834_01370 [bacterium]|nr:hypothetical protein [bacterium]
MAKHFRFDAFVITAIAVLFVLFFNFTKQNPALSAINPFATDPYDAIGSFGIQAAMFFAGLSLFRTYYSIITGRQTEDWTLFLVRSQIVTILTVIVTLTADWVTMIRHLTLWLGKPGGLQLAQLTLGFWLAVILLLATILHSTAGAGIVIPKRSWQKPLIATVLVILGLFFYPEDIIESTPGALLTVVIGAVFLFLLVRQWAEVFSPTMVNQAREVTPVWAWGGVILAGIILGLAVVMRELTTGGSTVDLSGKAAVIAIYVGLEIAGVLIGYTFLGTYLGLSFKKKIRQSP